LWGGWEERGRGREKVTERGEEVHEEEEEGRMDFGGRPRVGGWAGEVSGGSWACLRRWTETVSVQEPIWRVKK
jgi:hypothetical protein